MGQEEVLHLLSTEVNLVIVVAFDGLRLIHRIVQGNQELLEGLHHRRRLNQIHVMNVSQPDREQCEVKVFSHSGPRTEPYVG